MANQKFRLRIIALLTSLILATSLLSAQQGFDNSTRALFIFDLSKYIDYGPGLADSATFKIGVLGEGVDLFFEMGNLRKTRPTIQDNPVELMRFQFVDRIRYTEVLFLSKESGIDIKKVQAAIKGKKTLLITEGYEFRESMINFVAVDGEPRFSVNDDMIREAGMTVNQNVLAMAIKSKEDWENLFAKASEEILLQRDTIKQQLDQIETQKAEILHQKALLDSLDAQITEKEKVLNEKQKQLANQLVQISKQQGEISTQKQTIIVQQQAVQVQQDTLAKQRENIKVQMTRMDEQLKMIAEQDSKIKMQVEAIEKQKLILYFISFVLLLFCFLVYYIYRGYKIKKEANIKLEEKNRTITQQRDEIEKQRDLAASQRDQIAYQKKHITDSIMYAKRIQTALIPSLELFSDKLDHFVLYKPLDIVSGDFYWVSNKGDIQVIIAADCTGHGVPGAFMSMLGVTMLNEIVNGKHITQPDIILGTLRSEIVKALQQSIDEDRVKDGMDIAVCTIDFKEGLLWYAGANNPLYLVRDKELFHYRADKMPASIHYNMQPFTLHRIELKKGDSFYIFSDGYADQFGGPKQKKFMTMQLKEKVVEMSGIPMIEQGVKLSETFEEWKGEGPQIDDVTLIGVRY
jgi:serine phosphatase RsbU (regulator of sigma subunit)